VLIAAELGAFDDAYRETTLTEPDGIRVEVVPPPG
jgi:hypothetical protein